jgi:hypothetical protein
MPLKLSTSLAVHHVSMYDYLLFMMTFTFPGIRGPTSATTFGRKVVEDVLRHC